MPLSILFVAIDDATSYQLFSCPEWKSPNRREYLLSRRHP